MGTFDFVFLCMRNIEIQRSRSDLPFATTTFHLCDGMCRSEVANRLARLLREAVPVEAKINVRKHGNIELVSVSEFDLPAVPTMKDSRRNLFHRTSTHKDNNLAHVLRECVENDNEEPAFFRTTSNATDDSDGTQPQVIVVTPSASSSRYKPGSPSRPDIHDNRALRSMVCVGNRLVFHFFVRVVSERLRSIATQDSEG